MGLQLIICVETNKKCKSDEMYIRAIVKHFFNDKLKNVRLNFVYMGSKTQYQSSKVCKDIDKFVDKYCGKSEVIYIFDTDKIFDSQTDITFQKGSEIYVKNKNYHYIWFCENIESVILSMNSIANKKQMAEDFLRKSAHFKWNEITPRLKRNTKVQQSSNILLVLCELLQEQ